MDEVHNTWAVRKAQFTPDTGNQSETLSRTRLTPGVSDGCSFGSAALEMAGKVL